MGTYNSATAAMAEMGLLAYSNLGIIGIGGMSHVQACSNPRKYPNVYRYLHAP